MDARDKPGHDDGRLVMHAFTYLIPLLKGAEITAIIAVASTALGAVLAFAAGIARASGGWLIAGTAIIYVRSSAARHCWCSFSGCITRCRCSGSRWTRS